MTIRVTADTCMRASKDETSMPTKSAVSGSHWPSTDRVRGGSAPTVAGLAHVKQRSMTTAAAFCRAAIALGWGNTRTASLLASVRSVPDAQ
jgi:hypothetical protein